MFFFYIHAEWDLHENNPIIIKISKLGVHTTENLTRLNPNTFNG